MTRFPSCLRAMFLVCLVCTLAAGQSVLAAGTEVETSTHTQTQFLSSTLWTGMNDVAVIGDYAYCGFVYGIEVLDVSNTAAPQPILRLDLPHGQVERVVAVGNLLYVADGVNGLYILDAGNPFALTQVAHYDLSVEGYASDLVVAENRVYLADGGAGLQVIDVSNPAQPTYLGNHLTPGYGAITHAAVSGNFVYLATAQPDGTPRFDVVDVTNPMFPSLVTSLNLPYAVGSISVGGNRLYIPAFRFGLCVYDITTPAAPVRLSTNNPFGEFSCHSSDVVVVGNLAYFSTTDKIGIFDVSNPSQTVLVGRFDALKSVKHLAVANDHVFVPDLYRGLRILDASDPASPSLTGAYDIPGEIQAMTIVGDYAYTLHEGDGLRITNIHNAQSPLFDGHVAVSSAFGFQDIVVVNSLAFAADYGGKLSILDVANPQAPFWLGSISTGDIPRNIAIQGDYAYLPMMMNGGLTVVNIADPANPFLVTHYDSGPGMSPYVAVSGNYAYLAVQSTLEVIDIGQPANPTLVSDYLIPSGTNFMRDLSMHNGLIYALANSSVISVIDVSNPFAPTQRFAYTVTEGVGSMTVEGSYAYVSSNFISLKIIDISNPAFAEYAGKYVTSGEPRDAHAIGDTVAFVDPYGLTFFVTNQYSCGDANDDGTTDISDVVRLIDYIFGGGPAPTGNLDATCDGQVDLSDAVYLINYIFAGGLPPCARCE